MTLDPTLHERARRLARRRGTSVSGLVETYLRADADGKDSLTASLVGSASLKEPSASPDPRRDALLAKYVHG